MQRATPPQNAELPNCISCNAKITSRHGYFRAKRRGYGFCSKSCARASHQLKRTRMNLPKDSTAERFCKYVKKSSEGGCHEWTGQRNKRGYGRMSAFGRKSSQLAHRVAWELSYGEIASDIDVCHSCDNPSCCNVAHLWLGTAKDNVLDMMKKGRNVPLKVRRGEEVNTSKLSKDNVLEIKKSTLTTKELSAKFNISGVQVNNIRSGRQWTHV